MYKRNQNGLAALTVTILLLIGMTLVLAFMNRGVIFEQRTSANQYRATKAYEMAEAGVDWALAQMNYLGPINSTCGTTGASNSFRSRYFTSDAAGVITPTTYAGGTRLQAGCMRTAAGLQCSCPSSSAISFPSGSDGPVFAVEFRPVVSQPNIIEVVSRGCTANDSRCVTGATGVSDATSTVRVLAAAIQVVGRAPQSPLTARTSVTLGAGTGFTITNTFPDSGGVTINAGTNYVSNPSSNISLVTLPGTPPSASIYSNDSSLSNKTPDQMFQTYFGMTKNDFRELPTTTVVTCPSGTCSRADFEAALAIGSNIWIEGNLDLQANATYGSVTNPITLVVNGEAGLRGAITINGLIYATAQNWDDGGSGGAGVNGALVAENAFGAVGSMTVAYDPNIFLPPPFNNGLFARVPGSWRDTDGAL